MNTNLLLKWFKASRPHTMALSFAVILAGSAQIGWQALRLDILLLALFAAGGFQLVSNFANDYGDFKKGTDAHRPEGYRALSAGNFSAAQVKNAIVIISIVSLICVVALVWRSPVSASGKWTMFGLGVASVIAALAYTLGKRPYGYYALGDVMVFLFFGLVGVVGSYYLQGGALDNLSIWLIAVAFGAFSTTVLNINNIRDSEKDRKHHKITLANYLGEARALAYQRALFYAAIVALIIYATLTRGLGLAPAMVGAWVVYTLYPRLVTADAHGEYNQCLAQTVKLTFLLSLPTAIVGLIVF